MKTEAEVLTDQTTDDSYESYVESQRGERQQPAEDELPKSEAEQAKSGADSEPAKTESQDDEPKWTPKQQKRLDQLTREKYELRGLNKAQESELTRLRAELAEARKGKPEAAAERETTEDLFAKYKIDVEKAGSYENALALLADKRAEEKAKVEVERILAERDKKTEEQKKKDAEEQLGKEYAAQITEFEKTHADYREKVKDILPLVADRQLIDIALGASLELTYWAATHPKEFNEILKMDDLSAAGELYAVRKTLSSTKPEVPTVERTRSPKPPGKVEGVTVPSDTGDEDSYEDFARKENARLRRK